MLVQFLYVCLFMVQNYETQPYKVVETIDQIEIRYYPSVTMVGVESPYSNNRNFNALFRYISGNNESGEKIAMTTPVHMKNNTERQEMAFVLPAKFNDNAPEPKGKGVRLFKSKAGHYGAIRYGGYTSETKQKFHTERLSQALMAAGKTIKGTPVYLSYDAPYKFYNRRNEVLIEIDD